MDDEELHSIRSTYAEYVHKQLRDYYVEILTGDANSIIKYGFPTKMAGASTIVKHLRDRHGDLLEDVEILLPIITSAK
jgi:hypothetical protein